MTKSAHKLPDAGGSFIRKPDGSLAPSPADLETTTLEAEPRTEKPAAKGDKQPVKEA